VAVAVPFAGLSLVGPLLALAAAFTAWTQLGRNDELRQSYAMANQELLSIKALADTVNSEAALAKIVSDGEGAISHEHTMWIAKRG
jgi:SMODS and SLOG-associating 2TM effector domain 1